MSFNTALSGLRAANTDLSVTGNNIANASTTGFKKSRTEFGDVYANSMLGSGSRTPGSGVLVTQIAQQFDQGNINITNNSLDLAINGNGFFILNNQGSPTYTRAGNFGLDNQGYIVSPAGGRLQGFSADTTGNVLTGALSDLRIQTSDINPSATSLVNVRFNLNSGDPVPAQAPGLPATVTGQVPASFDFSGANATSINLDLGGVSQVVALATNYTLAPPAINGLVSDINAAIAGGPLAGRLIASATAAGAVTLTQQGVNGGETLTVGGAGVTAAFGTATPTATAGLVLDINNANTYNWSTAATIYDSLGNPHTMTSYYVKNTPVAASGTNPAHTDWNVYSSLDSAPAHGLGTVRFGSNGSLLGVTPAGGTFTTTASLGDVWAPTSGGVDPLAYQFDVTGSSQFGSDFTTTALNQNGYAPGRLSSINIGDSGVVFARYSNGQALTLGQVALATFSNPQGMVPVGNTGWAQSFDSGEPVIGGPQTGSRGALQSGALEDSNVDISSELVNLILAQRNYQANAKTIETDNAVTQTIINLR